MGVERADQTKFSGCMNMSLVFSACRSITGLACPTVAFGFMQGYLEFLSEKLLSYGSVT